ncbi:hypothetical protein GQ457_14G017840 [Hibiscus cannabinus]
MPLNLTQQSILSSNLLKIINSAHYAMSSSHMYYHVSIVDCHVIIVDRHVITVNCHISIVTVNVGQRANLTDFANWRATLDAFFDEGRN